MYRFRSRFDSTHRVIRLLFVFLILLCALAFGFAVPAYAAPPQQSAPIENSIFPAAVQIILIVLVTEGVKSLARALGGTDEAGSPKINLQGKEAAMAYVIVGLAVYAVQVFLLPMLPPGVSDALATFLGVAATLLAGSGLFSMTSAFRVQK